MKLKEAISKGLASHKCEIIVNHKFKLFGCEIQKMRSHEHWDYIKNHLEEEIEGYLFSFSHRGYKTLEIRINSRSIETESIYYENLWYDKNNFTAQRRERYYACQM